MNEIFVIFDFVLTQNGKYMADRVFCLNVLISECELTCELCTFQQFSPWDQSAGFAFLDSCVDGMETRNLFSSGIGYILHRSFQE